MSIAVKVKNVSKSFNDSVILDDISIDFYENKRPVVDLVYLPGDLWSADVFYASCMDSEKLQYGPGSSGKIYASPASCFPVYP